MITVRDADVTAVLISGDWVNVTGVTVDWAEFENAATRIAAHGQYLIATISGGPNNGKKIVAPLSHIDGVRV